MNRGTMFVMKALLVKQLNPHGEKMEWNFGEVKVPIFYFLDENKFWHQLNRVLKLRIHNEYWIKAVIQQKPLNDWPWCIEPFTLWCQKTLLTQQQQQQYFNRENTEKRVHV